MMLSLGAVIGMSISPFMPVKRREPNQRRQHDQTHEHDQTIEFLSECRDWEHSPCQDLDVTKRDRFELLSAYLDGEVTPEERQIVLDWMECDPKARCLYDRLIRIRQGLRTDCARSCPDTDTVVTQVFQSLNYRLQLVGMAGVGVFVLGILSLLSGGIGHHQNFWRWASNQQPEYLEIALDQPAFPIPKAPTAAASLQGDLMENRGILPVDSEL
jgi:hypothetical protein